jgi:hypothetical protein
MSDPTPTLPGETQPSARFVRVMILLTILLFLLAAGVIAMRWLRTTEPAVELLVVGNDALSGAEASVRAVDETTPYTSTFGKGGRYALPFYLDPGSYIVRVTKDGEVIEEREVSGRAKERIIVDLSKWEQKIPTSQGESRPTPATEPTAPFAPIAPGSFP